MERLMKMIEESHRIVVFSGAGISVESGIPDFRSVDGLYHEHYDYPPETILSHRFFMKHPRAFYQFYKDKMLHLDACANAAHRYFAKLESIDKIEAIITQNIDGLHQKSGSKKVIELHGSVYRNHCMKCGKFYEVDKITENTLPYCECGGLIKPDVVLYEEALDEHAIDQAIKAIQQCDMLIIVGTSLSVYPAASFVQFYQGNRLVVINKDELSLKANLCYRENVGELCQKLIKKEAA